MQSLQELVQIVNRHKLKSLEVVDLNGVFSPKTSHLYDLIADQKVQNDEEAAAVLYPEADTTTAYRKTKAKLTSKLLSALFFIDAKQPSYNDRKRAYYECYRDWAAAKILMARNAFAGSVKLTTKVLFYAEKYEFTALAVECARFLRLYYGTKLGDRKKFEEYHQLFERYWRLYSAESELEHCYTDLLVHFVNRRSIQDNIQDRIDQGYTDCLAMLERCQSYETQLYGMLIELLVHSSHGDHHSVLEVCETYRHVFEKKDYLAETPLQIIYYQSLVCHIQLRKFKEGRLAAQKCLSLIEEGNFNWFKYQELHLILCTHTRRYAEAFEVLRKATTHKRFSHLTDSAQEIWKIYEAYVLFALLVSGREDIFEKTGFRRGRFLNETPIFSKDKQGLNAAILIAQFLLLLCEGKHDRMIDRTEALYKYAVRYLQEEHSIRSFYFIKLLIIIVNKGFDPLAAHELVQKYLQKLKEHPFTQARQFHEIEIIPYETLWEMIMQLLVPQPSHA